MKAKSEVEFSATTAEALDALNIVGHVGMINVDLQAMAWIAYVLPFVPDTARAFPRGKWATIQHLQSQLRTAAEQRASEITPIMGSLVAVPALPDVSPHSPHQAMPNRIVIVHESGDYLGVARVPGELNMRDMWIEYQLWEQRGQDEWLSFVEWLIEYRGAADPTHPSALGTRVEVFKV